MLSMRRQLDAVRDQLLIQSLQDSTYGAQAKPLVSLQRPRDLEREPKIENDDLFLNPRRYANDAVPERNFDMPVLPQKGNF